MLLPAFGGLSPPGGDCPGDSFAVVQLDQEAVSGGHFE